MKFIVYFVTLSLLLLSCGQKNKSVDLLSNLPHEEDIEASLDSVGFSVEALARPLAMVSFGDYIVIAQDKFDFMVSIFNLKTGEEQRILPKGHGQNELLSIYQMQVKDSISFYVYDNLSQKLLLVRKDKNGVFKINRDEHIDDYLSLAINDSLLIGCCIDTDYRYKIHNKLSKKEEWVGDYESFGIKPNVGKLLLLGHVADNSRLGRMLWLSFYGAAWQVVSYKGNREVMKTKIYELPLYHTDDTGEQAIFEKETKLGFTSVTHNNHFVFALYSGQLLEMALKEKDKVTMGRHIIVLDWDGNMKECMNTKNEVKQIAYNQEQECLFLLLDEKEGYKLKYLGY